MMMLLLLLVFLLDVGTEVLGIIHSFNKRFSVFISVVVSFGKCVTAVYFCNKVLISVKVLGKVWPGFKNIYDLDIYDLR